MFGFYGGQLKRFMVFIQNKIDKLNLNLGTSFWKASTILCPCRQKEIHFI